MPPRRERRTGEGPQQPRCHYPGHHNTFIFSGLTGFETGRYSRAVAPVRRQRSTAAAAAAVDADRQASRSWRCWRSMLVRYHRFRDLLIHERRGWPMKFFFAFSLGLLLTAGVVARLLLSYNAADLTLEGAFLAGLVAGP